VALYAADARWRRAVQRGLTGSGHAWRDASSPADLSRVLVGQRFDVLVLKVRDDREARALSRALEDAKLPLHTILVGSVSALPLLPRRRSGTFRFVPGRLAAQEVGRLVDVSISAGGGEDWSEENGVSQQLEELDLEEAIERAAAAVYPDASRKRQRFHSSVVGPDTHALADPLRLREALVSLLRLTVSLAAYRALISVEAQAGRHEWLVRIRAGHNGRPSRTPGHLAGALQQETKTLAAVSRAVARQGGMLWVELAGPAALAFSMTLQLPEGVQTASA
jgi:hypothetical protein